jgi:hypothetical protein
MENSDSTSKYDTYVETYECYIIIDFYGIPFSWLILWPLVSARA